jgi:hypothetical protein
MRRKKPGKKEGAMSILLLTISLKGNAEALRSSIMIYGTQETRKSAFRLVGDEPGVDAVPPLDWFSTMPASWSRRHRLVSRSVEYNKEGGYRGVGGRTPFASEAATGW